DFPEAEGPSIAIVFPITLSIQKSIHVRTCRTHKISLLSKAPSRRTKAQSDAPIEKPPVSLRQLFVIR
ncbi:MAG: hypothetical protein JXR40_13400, partial [Pontiellaceae bacterium]|nr:hypothetical protein [Pontiellaceae bacterium]